MSRSATIPRASKTTQQFSMNTVLPVQRKRLAESISIVAILRTRGESRCRSVRARSKVAESAD
jgi:hypothetical protein